MRKMDEMELKISLESIRWAWFFTVIALFVWGIYDFIKLGKITPPIYLLIIQNSVYFFATHISKWKVGDKNGQKAILFYLIMLVVFIIVFGAIIFFL